MAYGPFHGPLYSSVGNGASMTADNQVPGLQVTKIKVLHFGYQG